MLPPDPLLRPPRGHRRRPPLRLHPRRNHPQLSRAAAGRGSPAAQGGPAGRRVRQLITIFKIEIKTLYWLSFFENGQKKD